MSESLTVEVYRLRSAHEQTVQRVQDILRHLDPVLAESDDLNDLLESLEAEVQRLSSDDS